MAAALQAHSKYDDENDWDEAATTTNIADFYTQNFIVVYTIDAPEQTLYILSNNDPYAENDVTKPYALPKTTTEADQSGTDYFKNQGEPGDSLIKYDPNRGSSYNAFDVNKTWSDGQYDTDPDTGEAIHHTPSIPEDDPNNISGLAVYSRQKQGYYIKKAVYQVTDADGKVHTVTFKVNPTENYDPEQATSDNVDRQLLKILNYLTTGYNSDGGNGATFDLISDGYSADQSPFKIEVDGLTGSSIDTSDEHLQLVIPSSATWVYDGTKYDNSNQLNLDPHPQIITLTYASYGEQTTEEHATVQETIHYQYADGTQAAADYRSPVLTYTRQIRKNSVTGEITNVGDWIADAGNQTFADQQSPAIDGFTPDQTVVKAPSIDLSKLSATTPLNLEYTVVYSPNQKPVEQKYAVTVHYVDENGTVIKDPVVLGTDYQDGDPYDATTAKDNTIIFNGQTYDYDKTTSAAEVGTINKSNVDVTYVYKLNQPEQPTSPSQPTEPGQSTQSTTVNQPSVPGQEPAAQPQTEQKVTQDKLPQTGSNSSASVVGMGDLLGMFVLLGFGKRKKRDEN